MSKSKSGVSSIRIVVDGYIMMIVVLLLLQLSRLLFTKTSIEMAAVGAALVGWLLLFFGFHKMSRNGAEFKRGRVACVFGFLMVVCEAFYIMKDIKAGLGESTFIDVFVLFFWFMGICALLYTYAKALKGMYPIVEMTDERLAAKYPRTALLVGTIVVLTLVFMPVMQMLPKVTGYVGTLILGLVAAVAQGYICKLLLDGYHAVRANTDDAKRAAAAPQPVETEKQKAPAAPRRRASKTRVKAPAQEKMDRGTRETVRIDMAAVKAEAAAEQAAKAEAAVAPAAEPEVKAAPEAAPAVKAEAEPAQDMGFDQSFMAAMTSAAAGEDPDADFWAPAKESSEPAAETKAAQNEAETAAAQPEEEPAADGSDDFWI